MTFSTSPAVRARYININNNINVNINININCKNIELKRTKLLSICMLFHFAVYTATRLEIQAYQDIYLIAAEK